jgi:hypothetical protein
MKTNKNADSNKPLAALLGLYNHVADILGKGKRAMLATLRADMGVKVDTKSGLPMRNSKGKNTTGNNEAWLERVSELKAEIGWDKFTLLEKKQGNQNLKYLRYTVGVKARKIARSNTERLAPLPKGDKAFAIALPSIKGKPAKEVRAFALAVWTQLDTAFGTIREETRKLMIEAQ